VVVHESEAEIIAFVRLGAQDGRADEGQKQAEGFVLRFHATNVHAAGDFWKKMARFG
jgi:hypothetical protein